MKKEYLPAPGSIVRVLIHGVVCRAVVVENNGKELSVKPILNEDVKQAGMIHCHRNLEAARWWNHGWERFVKRAAALQKAKRTFYGITRASSAYNRYNSAKADMERWAEIPVK